MSASAHQGLSIIDYLSRKPEKLLLEGLRQWNGGYETGCMACWETASDLLTEELGFAEAAEPLFLMAQFVRRLRQGTERALQFYPAHCRRMGRDECCLMAMVAAAQDNDRLAFDIAAGALNQTDRGDELFALATQLANALAARGLNLLPVPATVIAPIAGCRLSVS
jgi:hypothetical protein